MEKNTIQSDVIRGNINTIILKALYGGERYGYDIIKEINEATSGQYDLKQPTLYSCLTRLESQGFIQSYWGSKSNGGRRKYYSLTDLGREVFLKSQSDWEFSRTVMDRLISNKTVDLDAMAKKQSEDSSEDSTTEDATINEDFSADSQTAENSDTFAENIQDIKDNQQNEYVQALETTPNSEYVQALEQVQSLNNIDELPQKPIKNEHIFADTSDIMNKLFSKELSDASAVSYTEKIVSEKYIADKTIKNADKQDSAPADYFQDFYDESEVSAPYNNSAKIFPQEASTIPDDEKEQFSATESPSSTQKTLSKAEQTEQEKRIAEKEHFMNYNDKVAKMETAATNIFEREYRNILGYITNSCFTNTENHFSPSTNKENLTQNFDDSKKDTLQNSNKATISSSNNIENSEENFEDDDVFQDDINAVSQLSTTAYTNDSAVNKKFSKMANDVRDLGDNIKIRTALNDTSKEYTQMFHFYSNKLMLKHYAILFGIMLTEILLTSIVVFLGLKINRQGDVYYYIGAVALSLLFPTVAFIKNYSQPNKTKRINFSIKNNLVYRIIIMLLCFLIIYCYNLLINMPLTFSIDYATTLILPALLCTNFLVSAFIFNALFKSKKYSVN